MGSHPARVTCAAPTPRTQGRSAICASIIVPIVISGTLDCHHHLGHPRLCTLSGTTPAIHIELRALAVAARVPRVDASELVHLAVRFFRVGAPRVSLLRNLRHDELWPMRPSAPGHLPSRTKRRLSHTIMGLEIELNSTISHIVSASLCQPGHAVQLVGHTRLSPAGAASAAL